MYIKYFLNRRENGTIKKVSDIAQVSSINNDDEFLVIDKSRTDGIDGGLKGRNFKKSI